MLALTGNEYGNGAAGATFLERPKVAAADIVLADGTLEQISRHVVGIGEQRERLIEAGQHLKRGVLRLDGDADATFLLTTNRVELLERALAERPGRVDLAVEIDLPDAHARRRLFTLYAVTSRSRPPL